jgi:hypothetical protein
VLQKAKGSAKGKEIRLWTPPVFACVCHPAMSTRMRSRNSVKTALATALNCSGEAGLFVCCNLQHTVIPFCIYCHQGNGAERSPMK